MSGAAILCSGQGYQGADMFNLLADAPAATPVFEAAKFVLDGKDPRQLVREAGNDDLHTDKVGLHPGNGGLGRIERQGATSIGGCRLQRG
jgi:hypothetical protein